MTARSFRNTGHDNWQGSRPTTDADRFRKFGRVRPMAEPRASFWRHLLGRRA